jgi:hypothetical protein
VPLLWDTDEDGYDEPYIVTVHYQTKKVVRIVARFDIEGVELDTDEKGKEKLIRIEPIHTSLSLVSSLTLTAVYL